MKIEFTNGDGYYWAARADLNKLEWPSINNAWDDDTWIARPIRQWVLDRAPDSCFTCDGMVLFHKRTDAEWFRMVWEQVP